MYVYAHMYVQMKIKYNGEGDEKSADTEKSNITKQKKKRRMFIKQ